MGNLDTGKSVVWIFLLFIITGLVLTFFTFGKPCVNTLMAKRWVKVQCTIVKAQAVSRRTTVSDGGHSRLSITTKIDIMYDYMYGGQKLRSSNYGFFELLNHTPQGAKAIVARYPNGSTTVCYVNPDKPSESVLQRDIEAGNLLGLVPLVFTAAGVFGLWRRHRGQRRANIQTAERKDEIELKSRSRVKDCLGFFVVGLVFCGAAIFLWKRASPLSALNIVPAFLSVVFGIVGLILLFVSVNLLLAIFNPQVRLKLMPSSIEIGKAGAIIWEVQGRIERLRKLTVLLECRKEQKIIRNDQKRTTTTNTTKLYSEELLAVSDVKEIQKGEIGFVIGPEQARTFRGTDESIRWYVIVKGDIKWWPDIKDEFEFEVSKNHETVQEV